MVCEVVGAEWATAPCAASGATRLSARPAPSGVRRNPARRVAPDLRLLRLHRRVR
jgi:hypothetical protein